MVGSLAGTLPFALPSQKSKSKLKSFDSSYSSSSLIMLLSTIPCNMNPLRLSFLVDSGAGPRGDQAGQQLYGGITPANFGP